VVVLDAALGAALGAAALIAAMAAVAAAAIGSGVEPLPASGLVTDDGRAERRPAGVEAAEAAAALGSGGRQGTGSVYSEEEMSVGKISAMSAGTCA